MIKIQKDTLVLNLERIPNIRDDLEKASNTLDLIQKSLTDYLETKR